MKNFVLSLFCISVIGTINGQDYLPDPAGVVGITGVREGDKYSVVVLSLKDKKYGVDSIFTKISEIDSATLARELVLSIDLYKKRSEYIFRIIEDYQSASKSVEAYENMYSNLTGKEIESKYIADSSSINLSGQWVLTGEGIRDTLEVNEKGKPKSDKFSIYPSSSSSIVLSDYFDNKEVTEMKKQFNSNKLKYEFGGVVHEFQDKKSFARAIKRKSGVEFISIGRDMYYSKTGLRFFKI